MTEPGSEPPPPYSSGRSSALIGAGILLSRILGLLRQSLIARYLGTGWVADAFNGAFRLTNILQNLFGEGALSASFIPVYAGALHRGDKEESDRIAGAVAAMLATVVALLVLLGVVFAPIATRMFVGGFEGEKLTLAIRLTRVFFPGAGLFVMSAWCLGVLNSHRRFFLSYVAPVFWNIAMIAALLFFGSRRNDVGLAIALAWASLAGAALQLLVQMPTVLRLLHGLRLRLDLAYPPAREVARNFVPAFFSRGVVWLSTLIDMQIASFIAVDGVVTLLQNATTIYVLPISLFGMTVSAAELPEMARDSASGDAAFARLRARLDAALPRVAFFVVPSAVAFIVLGQAVVAVLLEHGRFMASDSQRAWAILAGSSVGLVASALGRLYSSTFYALRDTRTPLRFAIVRVVLTAALGYLFAFPVPRLLGLPAWTGAAGLTASAGVSGWIEFALLRRAVARRIGETGIRPRLLATLWGSAALAGLLGFAVMRAVPAQYHTIRGLAAIATFALVYAAATVALDVGEARTLLARVMRR